MTTPSRNPEELEALQAEMLEIEERLRREREGQRRLAHPDDYLYDKSQGAFWDTKTNSKHSEKEIDNSIPRELWRREIVEPPAQPEGAAPRRGRPPQRRERVIPPSQDISRVENNQFVECSTWWPGMEQIIHDQYFSAEGMRHIPGVRAYNTYMPPLARVGGSAERAEKYWVAHVKKLWPNAVEHEYFFNVCAHMVQHPEEKCHGAIVLSGDQRIGKDSALHAMKMVIGPWNAKNVDPDEVLSQYQPWLQSLMLTLDEVRPTKDEYHAAAIYNKMKTWTVTPPDTLPVNDKYINIRYVKNVLRIFITTNNFMDMYVPHGDQRTFIMHSELESHWHVAEGRDQYFVDFYEWLNTTGPADLYAWLMARDISAFKPNGEMPKTEAWNRLATTWGEPEDGVTQVLDLLGRPDVMFGAELVRTQSFDVADELSGLLKSPNKLARRMYRAGYDLVNNLDGEDRWAFHVEGKVFRSKLAFKRKAARMTATEAYAALRKRGLEIAKAGSAGPQLKVV